MISSKVSAFAIGAALLFQAGGASAFSNEAVAEAEKLRAYTVDRASKGEVTATDVAQVEAYILEMKLEAGTITPSDYCAGAISELQKAHFGVSQEARVGQRTTADIINAQREMHRVRARCQK